MGTNFRNWNLLFLLSGEFYPPLFAEKWIVPFKRRGIGREERITTSAERVKKGGDLANWNSLERGAETFWATPEWRK